MKKAKLKSFNLNWILTKWKVLFSPWRHRLDLKTFCWGLGSGRHSRNPQFCFLFAPPSLPVSFWFHFAILNYFAVNREKEGENESSKVERVFVSSSILSVFPNFSYNNLNWHWHRTEPNRDLICWLKSSNSTKESIQILGVHVSYNKKL